MTKLGQYIKIEHGFAFKTQHYSKTGKYRLVTLGNFEEGQNCFKLNDSKKVYYASSFPEKVILKENDLILPLTEQVVGLFGNSAFVPRNNDVFVLNQRVGKIKILNNAIDKYYLHYLLATPLVKKQLEARANGTKQRNISPSDIYDVEVELPDIKIQQKIGNFLYKIEKLQISNVQLINLLESIIRTIYDYWFLQFEFPNEQNKPYKSSGGKMVYNEELKREIPNDWKVKMLGEVCETVLGGTPSRKNNNYWDKGDINWLNSGEISQFPVVSSDEKITKLGLNESATKLMKEGTVVISITGNIRCSILAIESCANQSVVGINENNILTKEYMYPLINKLLLTFQKKSTGNCQQHINKDQLEHTHILIPSENILKKYVEITKPLFESIINNAIQNTQLKSLRDFLLPLLMNGQVK